MIDALVKTVERRESLPPALAVLVGEPDAMGYADLQKRIGELVQGEEDGAFNRLLV